MFTTDQIMTMAGYSPRDMAARFGRPSKTRNRWWRRQHSEFVSPHEAARAAAREAQRRIMHGEAASATAEPASSAA